MGTKHLERIDQMLMPGEQIAATVSATLTQNGSTSGTTRGNLAITNQRLLFAGSAIGAKDSRSIPLDQVNSIDLRKNLMTAHIDVLLSGGSARYLVKYKEAEPFTQAAQQALASRVK